MSQPNAPCPTAHPSPAINMYAEYLPKLGRLSIVVNLPSPSNQTTKASIVSMDKSEDDASSSSRLVVIHEACTSEMVLPVRTTATALPGTVPAGLEKLSWALRPANGGGLEVDKLDEQVPWSAAEMIRLGTQVGLGCRRCAGRGVQIEAGEGEAEGKGGAVVVERGRIDVWKDLPSENWAEMMEFWHCHKPVVPATTTATAATNGKEKNEREGRDDKASEEQLASRGYGANSAIFAQQGVGFVDLTTVLLHEEDFQGNVVETTHDDSNGESKKKTHRSRALCPGCGTQLGHLDICKGGISLFKWKLSLLPSPSPSSSLPSPPPTLSQCLAAALIANQARSGSAKVVLQGETEAIIIWTLNPHVKFSSCLNQSCTKSPTTAMKLLYKEKAMEDDEDEMNLPDEAVREVSELLKQGNGWLPGDEKVKSFGGKGQEWRVTLLARH